NRLELPPTETPLVRLSESGIDRRRNLAFVARSVISGSGGGISGGTVPSQPSLRLMSQAILLLLVRSSNRDLVRDLGLLVVALVDFKLKRIAADVVRRRRVEQAERWDLSRRTIARSRYV